MGPANVLLMQRRLLSVIAMLAATALGCGYADGGHVPPDVQLRPLAPVTLRFVNAQGYPLYLDWTLQGPRLQVSRDGTALNIDTNCTAPCDESCSCSSCLSRTPTVRVLPAGHELPWEWEPVQFLIRSCGAPGCQCADRLPLAVGPYVVELSASRAVMDTESPEGELLEDAQLDPEQLCTATIAFDLEGGQEEAGQFVCTATP